MRGAEELDEISVGAICTVQISLLHLAREELAKCTADEAPPIWVLKILAANGKDAEYLEAFSRLVAANKKDRATIYELSSAFVLRERLSEKPELFSLKQLANILSKEISGDAASKTISRLREFRIIS